MISRYSHKATLPTSRFLSTIAIGCCAILSFGIANATESTSQKIDQEFIKYDPDFLKHRQQYGERLLELGRKLAHEQARGANLHCSEQIYLEAKWLHRYTAYWDALSDKLDRLQSSMLEKDQAYAARQSPVDGGWGVCYEREFFKIGATIDGLGLLHDQGLTPAYRIKDRGSFSSEKLLTKFKELSVSDIANTGVNHRGQLSSLITSFSQGVFKTYIKESIEANIDRNPDDTYESIARKFKQFLEETQHPDTGFWGAMYLIDGELHRTSDLSMTYHIVAYSKGKVKNWPKILSTTIGMESKAYPYGWLSNGNYNNHNLYDVAKIYKYGWKHMSGIRKLQVQAQIKKMLDWSLNNTVNDDGSFVHNARFSDSYADAIYFGVSFLDVVGFWKVDKRFWDREFTYATNMQLCCSIRQHLNGLELTGWAANGAVRKLERNCGC